MRVEDLHREIGVIFQDFMRYDLTARQNIAVGRMERNARGDEIELAAQELGGCVISRLPLGYEQLLGRRGERGPVRRRMAEGGSRARLPARRSVAGARRTDRRARRPIGCEVFQRFADLSAGKTTLLISHRFSTVRMADRIVVLADGQIAEQGSHAELLAGRGHYAGMFELQAASYR